MARCGRPAIRGDGLMSATSACRPTSCRRGLPGRFGRGGPSEVVSLISAEGAAGLKSSNLHNGKPTFPTRFRRFDFRHEYPGMPISGNPSILFGVAGKPQKGTLVDTVRIRFPHHKDLNFAIVAEAVQAHIATAHSQYPRLFQDGIVIPFEECRSQRRASRRLLRQSRPFRTSPDNVLHGLGIVPGDQRPQNAADVFGAPICRYAAT